MAEELTQEQLAEWGYLAEQEQQENSQNQSKSNGEEKEQEKLEKEVIEFQKRSIALDTERMNYEKELEKTSTQKEREILEKKIKEVEIKQDVEDQNMYGHRTPAEMEKIIQILDNPNNNIGDLAEKRLEKIREHEEKKVQKAREEKIRQNLGQNNANLNEHARQAINTLGEKEQVDEQIKEKQAELDIMMSNKQKREFVKDRLDEVDKNENLKESMNILQEKEKIEEQIKAKEAEIEAHKNGKENEHGVENAQSDTEKLSAEQEDWNKRADELELQHEKELEALKDQQSKLEANFQKSIDNLMNSNGIESVITALQELDRSLEMMLKQGKEDSEAKDRQRQEKLELAFDSPNFKQAVGNLVKETYENRKKVKSGLNQMEKERANYAKMRDSYDKQIKKGLDYQGYEKMRKMMADIEKDTPNFKEAYPKFYQKVNKTLDEAKDKILNKDKKQEQGQGQGQDRGMQR